MDYLATGLWGRFAQYITLMVLIISSMLFVVSYWIKKDTPKKAVKLKKIGISLLVLIPAVFALVMLITGILFAIYWNF